MRLRRFSTVRTRLLALLVTIAIPIACASAFAAYATYRAAIVAIEAVQSRAVDDFAVRTRVWYRGMSRVRSLWARWRARPASVPPAAPMPASRR